MSIQDNPLREQLTEPEQKRAPITSRMLSVLLLISLGLIASAAGCVWVVERFKSTSSNLSALELRSFQDWSIHFSRSYASQEERDQKMLVFLDNHKLVNENSSSSTYSIKLNKFADLQEHEFSSKYLGFTYRRRRLRQASQNAPPFNISELPATIDWREYGAVTPIKEQGACGSCWAFSAVGAIEGLYSIRTKNQALNFSEQQILDCTHHEGSDSCHGGFMQHAFEEVAKHGIESNMSYPYTAMDRDTCDLDNSKILFQIEGYQDVKSEDEVALMAAVARQPVSAAVQANKPSFKFYDHGIINDPHCGEDLNHAILIVGYGTENGIDYWIIKNSWGQDWGENGFARIARTNGMGSGFCGIALEASYPI